MLPGLNIAFAGTPVFAAEILERLLKQTPHVLTSVYTQKDKPAGRGRRLQKSPVREVAEAHNLPVRQPENRTELQLDHGLEQVDVMVVAAYGLLIPPDVLARPRYGCINIHTSLLPRWRGAAPVQRAILAGDIVTGITIMQMDPGLDTGDILNQQVCSILPEDTTGSLFEKLSIIGSECLHITLEQLCNGSLLPIRQPETGITYAHKIVKSEAWIDWQRPAIEIDRQVRAFNPAPVACTTLANQTLRVWQVQVLDDIQTAVGRPGTILNFSPAGLDIACADKVIRILKLQLPGKRVMDCRDFFNGNPRFGASR